MIEGRFYVSGLEKSREASQKCIDLVRPGTSKWISQQRKVLLSMALLTTTKRGREVLEIIQLSQVN